MKPPKLKVALVCDWLTEVGGAERVLLAISNHFPDAPIYTSQYRPSRIDWFLDKKVHTGWLNIFPSSLRKLLGPLRQLYFSHLNLDDFDLVISVTGAEAKSIKVKKAKHLCYCHVPTQYYWALYDHYLKDPGFGFFNGFVRFFFKLMVNPLRRKDYQAAQKPDKFIAISHYSKQLIKQYYHRNADIIYPPVDVENFGNKQRKENNKSVEKYLEKPVENSGSSKFTFINFSRQVNWKRLDLAIKACLKTKDNLILVGEGPEQKNLQKLAQASPNIKFLPKMSQPELAQLLTQADGFIFPSLEPFGIAPIEAMAGGCPVLAYAKGGAKDYIKPGLNGILFPKQSTSSLVQAIQQFKTLKFQPVKVSQSVQNFNKQRFLQQLDQVVAELFKDSSV